MSSVMSMFNLDGLSSYGMPRFCCQCNGVMYHWHGCVYMWGGVCSLEPRGKCKKQKRMRNLTEHPTKQNKSALLLHFADALAFYFLSFTHALTYLSYCTYLMEQKWFHGSQTFYFYVCKTNSVINNKQQTINIEAINSTSLWQCLLPYPL